MTEAETLAVIHVQIETKGKLLDIPFHKTILKNGITVLTQPVGSVRSVAVGIFIKAGSQNETPATNGIAHFLEHMSFKGTAARNPYEIVQDIESRGGQINAYTSKDVTGYYARVLDTEVDSALSVLCDIVSHSSYPEEEIEKEKTVVLEEIRDSLDTPQDLAHDRFYEQLLPGHALGYPILGPAENVSSFTSRDLREFVKNNYTGERIIIAAAGNIEHDYFVSRVSEYMEEYPHRGEAPKLAPVPPAGDKQVEDTKSIAQAHYIMGRRSLPFTDSRRIPYAMLNAVLSAGMTSRLFHNIREKYGFLYTIYSFIDSYENDGIFGIYTATDQKHVPMLNDLIWKELNRLKDEAVSQIELEKVKAQVKGSIVMSIESMHHRLERMVQQHIRYGEIVSIDESIRKIDAVTAEDLQSLSQYLFNEEAFHYYLLKPSE